MILSNFHCSVWMYYFTFFHWNHIGNCFEFNFTCRCRLIYVILWDYFNTITYYVFSYHRQYLLIESILDMGESNINILGEKKLSFLFSFLHIAIRLWSGKKIFLTGSNQARHWPLTFNRTPWGLYHHGVLVILCICCRVCTAYSPSTLFVLDAR